MSYVLCLAERSRNDDRDASARLLLRRIANIKFLALLSGMVVIYDVISSDIWNIIRNICVKYLDLECIPLGIMDGAS